MQYLQNDIVEGKKISSVVDLINKVIEESEAFTGTAEELKKNLHSKYSDFVGVAENKRKTDKRKFRLFFNYDKVVSFFNARYF